MEDALLDSAKVGDRVVIYDDLATIVAPGLPEKLADLGKQVRILTCRAA